jgi:hypothetical protein
MAEPVKNDPEVDKEEHAALVTLLGQKDLLICRLQAQVKVLTGRLHASDGPARTQ